MTWTIVHDNHTQESVKLPNGKDTLIVEGDLKAAERYLHECFDLELYHSTCDHCGPDFEVFLNYPTVRAAAKEFGLRNLTVVNAVRLHELFPNTTPVPA